MDIKITTILENMEEYLESKGGMVFTDNIVVKKKEMLDYLTSIRTELPQSLNQASAIYEDRERILDDAHTRAENTIKTAENRAKDIVDTANAKAMALVEEHEITRKAKIRAEEILVNAASESDRIIAEAKKNSENMKKDTFDFVEEKITKLENTFSHAKYNSEYMKDEFYKNASALFHVLDENIEKEYEAILGNKRAFLTYRDELYEEATKQNYSDESDDE